MFLVDAMQQWFIYGRTPVSGMLTNHQVLGSHTDIYFFYHDGRISRLTWSHPGIRPFGTALALQCKCKSLKPWSPTVKLNPAKDDVFSIKLICKYCKHTKEYLKPANIRRLGNGKLNKSDMGDWYIETS
jgi:hypothetical protein